MKILALEFSSPQRSVAVLRRDELHESHSLPGESGTCNARPSEITETGIGAMRALGMVEDVLRDAKLEREEIECLVVGLGPGSYTGIRATIALMQGWQLAREIKLLGISSVECLAAQAQANGLFGRVNIVVDAQRNEFYLAAYEISADNNQETEALKIVSLMEIKAREQRGEILIGPEVTRWFPKGHVLFPSAVMLATLALSRTDFVRGEKLEPIYLREISFVKAPPSRIL
ncbi:MAG: tRNA threonylcarbamoyladenosine biosynthesis protein TsaB [Verrucomicrobiota bacterium]|jgi:tRNA threonylcarbamoyl adenosine modification protein YeaZ